MDNFIDSIPLFLAVGIMIAGAISFWYLMLEIKKKKASIKVVSICLIVFAVGGFGTLSIGFRALNML